MIFGLVGVILGGFFMISFWVQSGRVEVDRDTMCPRSGPGGHTVVLIDATDEFSAIQKADLKRYFSELKSNVPKYSQIAIYAPQEMSDEDFLSPELKICNPGDGQGISGITANPEQIKQRYKVNFSDKIDDVLDNGLNSEGAPISPVMEMIQAVSVDAFPINGDTPKRLIIVSDMLQNTDWYSHYRDKVDFEVAKANPRFQHVYVDLTGVEVEILYIGREGYEHLQTNGHGMFWDAFFAYMKGNLVSISRIGG